MLGSEYDILVVGAGHAGCEAALAAARLGCRTLLLTGNLDTIAAMPCNCSIGGPGKGHLVREIDALGGEMARNIDATFTHIRMLNTSKGLAVRALRAQADKRRYQLRMKGVLERQGGLELRQGMAVDLLGDRQIGGVRTATGVELRARIVILATGTFLNGIVHVGEHQMPAGRAGEPAAEGLGEALRRVGLETGRLKTGTVPRVRKSSLDFGRVRWQASDAMGLRFAADEIAREHRKLLPCWQTQTSRRTREIVEENLDRSALYGGRIEGTGPRYCPSIEVKFVEFPEKKSHIVFLEQEGWDTDEIYVQGLSSSLPEDVQLAMLRSVPGLESAVMMRPGYAIEYDFVPPQQIAASLKARGLEGLYLAGQVNGTSGYEEAAAQGLMAGINAAGELRGDEPIVLGRDEAYTGVLIDDLVTKGTEEPYRMLTSRAEHRLLLAHDTARVRLLEAAAKARLVPRERLEATRDAVARVKAAEAELGRQRVRWSGATGQQPWPVATSAAPAGPVPARGVLARPGVTLGMLRKAGIRVPPLSEWEESVLEYRVKYEGYLAREQRKTEQRSEHERTLIPPTLSFEELPVRLEAREKWSRVRPRTIGEASRIPGITPADVAMLLAYVKQGRKQQVCFT